MVPNQDRATDRLSLFENSAPLILSVRELAERLRLSENGVRKLVRKGKIPALHAGRSIRFDWDEVLVALMRQ